MSRGKYTFAMLIALLSMTLVSCTSAPAPTPLPPPPLFAPPPPPPLPPPPPPLPPPPVEPPPPGEIVKVRVVVTPDQDRDRDVPKGSRIVITDIDGACALEVRDALMRRLVDNADYEVLTRENLRQIMIESKQAWTGDFNTRTAVKLGELLSASLFIVGRVVYCGSPTGSEPSEDSKGRVDILAVLQIIDLQTGRVVVSSASEGIYVPKSTPLLVSADTEVLPIPDFEVAAKFISQQHSTKSGNDAEEERAEEDQEVVDFPTMQAAEDLANDFADKFFSRSTWEDVEMWTSPSWSYGGSIRYVKLGHCPEAVSFLEKVGSQELRFMPDRAIARYLHNFGVALLCNNEPERAINKLRSAYRIDYSESTRSMLELAAKVEEWSLTVEVDNEPEVGLLVRRSAPYKQE